MPCIIQTSDWHLGRPFGNAGARADELRGLQADCVRNRMPAAIREAAGDEVDVILVAGDVFDSSEGIQDGVVRQVIQAFTALAEIAPVVVIPGNHDEPGPGSVWESVVGKIPARVTICCERSVVRVPGTKLVVLAVPPRADEPFQDAIDWCAEMAENLEADDIPIGLAHGAAIDFASLGPSSVQKLNFSPLVSARIPYMALGDWHSRLQVQGTEGRVAYSGAPEPLKCDECAGGIGVVLKCTVTTRDVPPRIAAVPVGKVPWFSMESTLQGDMSAEDAIAVIEKAIYAKAGSSAFAQSAIVRLRILGNGLDATIREVQSASGSGGALAGSVRAFIPDVDCSSVTVVASQASLDEAMAALSPRMKRTLEGVLATVDADVRVEAQRMLLELVQGKQ